MDRSGAPLLEVTNLAVGYGERRVLEHVTFHVDEGDFVAILGPNGAGKSTLLKAIFGLLVPWTGTVSFERSTTSGTPPGSLRRQGLCYVPQGPRVFGSLTVAENLRVGALAVDSRTTRLERVKDVLALYPQLCARMSQRAATLSGGEKQMLVLASAMIVRPRCLLVDEPSLGLAPPLLAHTLRRLRELNESNGVAVVMVEQKIREALSVARRAILLNNGRVLFDGPSDSLPKDGMLLESS